MMEPEVVMPASAMDSPLVRWVSSRKVEARLRIGPMETGGCFAVRVFMFLEIKSVCFSYKETEIFIP